MVDGDNMNDDASQYQNGPDQPASETGLEQNGQPDVTANSVTDSTPKSYEQSAQSGRPVQANPLNQSAQSVQPSQQWQPAQPEQAGNFAQPGMQAYPGQQEPMTQQRFDNQYAPMQDQPSAGQNPTAPMSGAPSPVNSSFPYPPQASQNPEQGYQYPPAMGPNGGMAMAEGVPVKKKSSKAVVAVVTVVIVIVVVVAVVLGLDIAGVIGGPKEKDYKAGQDDIAIMTHSLTSMTTDFVSASLGVGRDGVTDQKTSQFKTDKEKYEQANADFKNLKVMKDSNVKAAYDAYMPKARGFDTYMDGLSTGMQKIASLKDSCTNENDGGTVGNDFYHQQDAFFSQCSAKIQSVGKLSNKPIADFLQSMQNYLNTKNGILKQMEAMGDPNAMTSQAQVDQLNALVDKFNAVPSPEENATSLQESVTKDISKTDPTKSLNNLKTVVDNGARAKRGSLL
ncbi:hypothetical protein OZX57_03695 [Bifidobacterium sp. ESL0682]|uniref:hypothetical protein n=1 Tax=Bifidobacterium sp. ESL0682 TaxID=2983212 RepID=UPI0023F88E12|nr:hypothetical protein [Bifidobacterium sp. ESL0682]WEV42539.1 hypothetical protein OZX57_03695 [Bifidobacterium sp. ESL0682]